MTTKVHSQTEQPPRDKVRDSWLVKVIRQLCRWVLCLERKPIETRHINAFNWPPLFGN